MLGGVWNAQTVPAGYGGGWSVLWLAVLVTAGLAFLAVGAARRWPGLGVAAVAGLAVAALGVTGPGRDLLRSAQSAVAGRSPSCATGSSSPRRWPSPRRSAPAWPPPGWPAAPQRGRTRPPRPAGAGRAGAGPRSRRCWCSRRCCCCPGWRGGRPGGCAACRTRRSWLAAARADRRAARPRGVCWCCPGRATASPAWNGGRTVLDPWPRLLSRPVIWNDGPRVGRVSLRPDDPAARALDAPHPRRRPADRRAAGGRRAVRGQRRRQRHRPRPGGGVGRPPAGRHQAHRSGRGSPLTY